MEGNIEPGLVDTASLPPGARSVLYKTEICKKYSDTGFCRYGDKCQFAHGQDQLRPMPRHPKYKTEKCKTFWTLGSCPYGSRCRFLHAEPGSTGISAPNSPGMVSRSPYYSEYPPTPALSLPLTPVQHKLPTEKTEGGNSIPPLSIFKSGLGGQGSSPFETFMDASGGYSPRIGSPRVAPGGNSVTVPPSSTLWMQSSNSNGHQGNSTIPLVKTPRPEGNEIGNSDYVGSPFISNPALFRAKNEFLSGKSGHYTPLMGSGSHSRFNVGQQVSHSMPSSPLLSSMDSTILESTWKNFRIGGDMPAMNISSPRIFVNQGNVERGSLFEGRGRSVSESFSRDWESLNFNNDNGNNNNSNAEALEADVPAQTLASIIQGALEEDSVVPQYQSTTS